MMIKKILLMMITMIVLIKRYKYDYKMNTSKIIMLEIIFMTRSMITIMIVIVIIIMIIMMIIYMISKIVKVKLIMLKPTILFIITTMIMIIIIVTII